MTGNCFGPLYLYSDLSRVSEFRGLEREHPRKHHFITLQWVEDSIESSITRNERLYEPKN